MFETIKKFIGGIIGMFNKNTIESAMNVQTSLSSIMQNSIELWLSEYMNQPPWRNDRTIFSMNLAAGIASEFAKLVTIEFKSEISNNDFLNQEYQVVIDNIRNIVELACAGGAVVFKPYISNGHIEVDVVQANQVYPVSFNNRGEMTACVLPAVLVKGDTTYTRLESHCLNADNTYTITNKAFKIKTYAGYNALNRLGDEISLTEVEEWANLVPSVTLKDVEKPLFSYFKMPMANNIETSSPLGVSVYSRIAEENGLLNQIDKQYSRILWEFEGSELAVHADTDAFKKDKQGNAIMPEGKERLYRKLDIDATSSTTKQIDTFSPEIRDTPLFNGLNQLIRKAEFLVGLAYGTLSDMQESDKTATEVKASKMRSYQTVKDIQNNLKVSLEGLLYSMWYLGTLGKQQGIIKENISPVDIEKNVSFDFDDSIISDKTEDLNRLFTAATSGLLKPEYYIAKLLGISEEEALKRIPNQTTVNQDPFANSQE